MKKLLMLLILAVMLAAGTGVAGAAETKFENKEIQRITQADDYTILRKPVMMD